jgi:hypothetical protein
MYQAAVLALLKTLGRRIAASREAGEFGDDL